MKSALAKLFALFAVLFLGVTLFREARDETAPTTRSEVDVERIRSFWQAYDEATRARTAANFPAAVRLYRKALELDAEHEDTSFYLAVSLEQTGAYREAAEVLRELTRSNPSSGRGWSQLAAVLASRRPGARFDPDEAREAIARSEALNPEHSGPFLSRGYLSLEIGDDEQALRSFRIAADMGSPEGAFEAGLVAYRTGAWAEAVSSFRRVLDQSHRESRIANRGATSEGDVATKAQPDPAPSSDRGLTALESSRIKSLCFLYWTARRMGGYPADVPERDRITLSASAGPAAPGPVRLIREAEAEGVDEPFDLGGIDFDGTVVDTAVADVDGDGREDAFVLGWKTPGRLFRRDGSGSRFEDVTVSFGLENVGGDGLSALFFDFDADGDPDLLVTAHAPLALSLRRLLEPDRRVRSLTPRLFRNDGEKGFVEMTSDVGLDRHYGVMRARAHDVDGDGFLDLLFAMGAPEASHFEPSLVLRNLEGEGFAEWGYLPSIDEPHRAFDVRVAGDGALELLVAESSP